MAEESPVSDVAGNNPPGGTSPRKRQAIARPTPPDHAGAAAAAMSGLPGFTRCGALGTLPPSYLPPQAGGGYSFHGNDDECSGAAKNS